MTTCLSSSADWPVRGSQGMRPRRNRARTCRPSALLTSASIDLKMVATAGVVPHSCAHISLSLFLSLAVRKTEIKTRRVIWNYCGAHFSSFSPSNIIRTCASMMAAKWFVVPRYTSSMIGLLTGYLSISPSRPAHFYFSSPRNNKHDKKNYSSFCGSLSLARTIRHF